MQTYDISYKGNGPVTEVELRADTPEILEKEMNRLKNKGYTILSIDLGRDQLRPEPGIKFDVSAQLKNELAKVKAQLLDIQKIREAEAIIKLEEKRLADELKEKEDE